MILDWLQNILNYTRTEQNRNNFIENKLRPHAGGVRALYTNRQTKACNKQTCINMSKCNNEKEAEASHHHAYANSQIFMALKMKNFRWKMMIFLPSPPQKQTAGPIRTASFRQF